jgi:PleD family two-component response regulator
MNDDIEKYRAMYDQSRKWKDQQIMVVDDEEFCIAAMKAMLQQAGIDIVH